MATIRSLSLRTGRPDLTEYSLPPHNSYNYALPALLLLLLKRYLPRCLCENILCYYLMIVSGQERSRVTGVGCNLYLFIEL